MDADASTVNIVDFIMLPRQRVFVKVRENKSGGADSRSGETMGEEASRENQGFKAHRNRY